MTNADDFVLLAHAPNQAIASVWASLLEAKGIRAYTPGIYLADHWASWQGLVGGLGCDVHVPRSRLGDAKAIIAQASEDDDEPDTEGDSPEADD